jgi:hypothetical protein
MDNPRVELVNMGLNIFPIHALNGSRTKVEELILAYNHFDKISHAQLKRMANEKIMTGLHLLDIRYAWCIDWVPFFSLFCLILQIILFPILTLLIW